MSEVKKPLSTGEVAELCGVSLQTVKAWLQRSGLRGYRLPNTRRRGKNRHWRVTPESLREFLAKNEMPVPESLQIDAGGL